MRAAAHPRQAERLAALRAYGVLDTPPEAAFDEMTRLAATLCSAPIAVVNLIDEARQWFKSEVGLGVRELPLADSICAHAILEHEFVEIPDTLSDARFCDNPLCLSEPGLRFYAGALLSTDDGLPLGTLCVLDWRPRTLNAAQCEALRVLARQVMAQLELRRALTQQQRLADELAHANRRKDEFLAMLAHELRNPLAPLTNALRLIERTQSLDERGRVAMTVAERQRTQLGRLVDDLLEGGRITSGKIVLKPEPMELSATVAAVVESLAPMLQWRGHRLEVVLPDGPVQLVGDPGRMTQVLENLLRNAAKYTPDGGHIRIEVEPDDESVEIRVIDNGVGIEPSQISGLFQLFAQIDATLDRAAGGLGLGLALVKRLVELHGGTVRAESAGRGQGATFVVRLPRDRGGTMADATGA